MVEQKYSAVVTHRLCNLEHHQLSSIEKSGKCKTGLEMIEDYLPILFHLLRKPPTHTKTEY